jgi:Ca2+/H+ antiporter, TMEM165/GDT1 family
VDTRHEEVPEMLYLFAATYATVFVSELIGDKNIYTISSLAMRFRPVPVLCGLSAAFAVKMFAAILFGSLIAGLPETTLNLISALVFFCSATVVGLKQTAQPSEPGLSNYGTYAAMVAFGAIFFSEWGDIGQVTTAVLAARYQAPVAVWLAATLALLTKGVLAMALGLGLRKRMPHRFLRPIAVGICLIMGLASLWQLLKAA